MAVGVPIVSIVGHKGAGKTSVLERLVAELVARGYRVAAARRHAHPSPVDSAGKDSRRLSDAGAETTMVGSPVELAVFRRISRERTLDELAAEAHGSDILLTEGFGDAALVRVEVFRSGHAGAPRFPDEDLFALVTDAPGHEGTTVLPLDDPDSLADLVEATFLSGGGSDGR